jgi:lipoprotein NlpI
MRALPLLLVLIALPVLYAQSAQDLLGEAEQFVRQGKYKEAFDKAGAALAADPKNKTAYRLRALLHEREGRYGDAVKDLDKLVELDPKNPGVFAARGSARFKAGDIAGSITDFDAQIALDPKSEISHWQRGISYYYAGRFADGKKQFEGYQDFDDSDVENAVWRFMCMTRDVGIAKARAAMLKIGEDKRVPMRAIYDMYLDKLKPDDVIELARTKNKDNADAIHKQLFYAHLYVGIYHELLGDKAKALEHMEKAVEHRIGHYMWDVARVHRDLLKK